MRLLAVCLLLSVIGINVFSQSNGGTSANWTAVGATNSSLFGNLTANGGAFTNSLSLNGIAVLTNSAGGGGTTYIDGVAITNVNFVSSPAGQLSVSAVTNVTIITASAYRTIDIYAGSMIMPNASPASVSTLTAGTLVSSDLAMDIVVFATGAAQYAVFPVVMPETWTNGTVRVRFYWETSDTSGSNTNVVWQITANSIPNNTTLNALQFSSGAVLLTNGSTGQYKQNISASTASVTVTGAAATTNRACFFQIARIGTSASDNLASAANLTHVLLQYQEQRTPTTWVDNQ